MEKRKVSQDVLQRNYRDLTSAIVNATNLASELATRRMISSETFQLIVSPRGGVSDEERCRLLLDNVQRFVRISEDPQASLASFLAALDATNEPILEEISRRIRKEYGE